MIGVLIFGALFSADCLHPHRRCCWQTTYGPLVLAYTNCNAVASHLNRFYTPIPAYELLVNLAIFSVLWQLRKRKWADGNLFLVYLILYSIERYVLGFVSAYRMVAMGLTQSQIIALIGLVFAVPALTFHPSLSANKPSFRSERTQKQLLSQSHVLHMALLINKEHS